MTRRVQAVSEKRELDIHMAQRNVLERKHKCKVVGIE